MRDNITVLCASVKGREESLKIALNSIYEQDIDEIHLVLNWYTETPDWIIALQEAPRFEDKLRDKPVPIVHVYLNPENKHAHDAVWFRVMGLDALDKQFNKSRYYFVIDDDLLYPADYIEKFIEAIDRHEGRAVITAHGANIVQPVMDYFQCRATYGFSDRQERDIFTDMAGCGVVGWHSSTISPTIQDFPIPYCRDLWFSILCAKREVPIVCLQRPSQWIMPLATEGDSVYELTKSNKKLQDLKNRILKEQFLPLLHCNRLSSEYVLITDYDFEEQLLVKSLATLHDVSPLSNKVVFSNRRKEYAPGKPLTQFVTEDEFNIGRMGSKVITQYRFMQSLPDESKVISADADLYYIKNPFEAFDYKCKQSELTINGSGEWDIAVTTRPYEYRYPINGGVVMFRINKNVRELLTYLMMQIYDRNWTELIEYQKQFGHTGNDWYIDQDIWCCCWLFKNLIRERFGVNIIDIGPKYNFCPHADGDETIVGKALLMDAFEHKLAHILHLKSRLKELLLDGSLS